MGYYTTFSLEATKSKETIQLDDPFTDIDREEEKEIAQSLYRIMFGEENNMPEINCFADVLCESMKWYEHQDEMRQLSAKYPDIFFELEGHGEEIDDDWRELYYGGKLCEYKEMVHYFPSYSVDLDALNEICAKK